MIGARSPTEAYRAIDFDARVAGSTPQDLVILSYEYFVAALDAAVFAHQTGDNARLSAALTRALAMLTSLQLGIDPGNRLAPALADLYEAARRAVLDSVVHFEPAALRRVRADFAEISVAFVGA